METKLWKRGLSIVLAGMMAASLAGTAMADEAATESAAEAATEDSTIDPSRKSTANSDERLDKITIGISSDPSDLGPTGYGDNSAQYVLPNIWETLFDFRNNEYIPILAKGYTEVDDTHWDVEIYDYIHDSEGNPITADDIVYSYQLLMDSGKNAKWETFGDIEAKDDYTVEFTWTKPIDEVGELEWILCRCFIVSQKAAESGQMSSEPVGTGPYVVTEYDPGAKIVMEANDNYWQTDELRDAEHMANVQTIEYDIISETSQHVIALSNDTIQYSEYVPNENLADFEEGGQYAQGHQVFATQGSALHVLFANCSEGKATSDINLRYAIFYALNNDAIAEVSGTDDPAKAFGTPFFSDYNTDWESQENNYMVAYDPDLAKEYLSKSSYNGETLSLLCGSDEASRQTCTMIQTLLLQVGINVEINSEDGNLQDEDMRDVSKWDLNYKDIGGGSQIGEWNRPVNNTEFGTGYNLGGIKDDTLQQYLKTCASIEGHTEENMSEMHQYILDNAYYYGVSTPRMTGVYSDVFAKLVYRENEFLRPGSCEYYLD